MRTKARNAARRITGLFLPLMGFLFLYPLLLTLSNSLMTENEIAIHYATERTYFDLLAQIEIKFAEMLLIPQVVSVEQYTETLIYQPSFMVLILNSLKITVPVVIGNAVVSLLTAYGFTMWKWKYKEILFFVYIIVMLMPLQAVLVPNYIIADQLHIKDSYLAIILPGVFAPFGTFLLKQSMKAMPLEYFEAAAMDGAGVLHIFNHVVAPQMKSGLAALCMLVFIEYWNLVEQAVIFIQEYYREPLSVYLSRITEGKIGIVFAASCVYMFFPLCFLLIGQKDLEKGIELSGIK